ncbi:MAG: hypothetical protein JNK67_31780 [Alphaproteobacteria bacterium]|nr:hypothetical protein [Alphaproteobacteria bacterium]
MRLRRLCWVVVAMTGLALDAPASAQERHFLGPQAGPPGPFTAYWLAQAWDDRKPRGPAEARGIVLWSHGVSGTKPQYGGSPPRTIRRLADAGWDVVKIQRNPSYENTWTNAGLRHVADLVKRADDAKAAGYKRVIAAGQSYGGAISIEASGRTDAIETVIAFAPGHGSDAATTSHMRLFDNLTEQLAGALRAAKAGRIVVAAAGRDALHPHELRGPKLRAALESEPRRRFVLFDETMPLDGHAAAYAPEFDAWYGGCLAWFIESSGAAPGETACRAPGAEHPFFVPPDLRVEPPVAGVPRAVAALSGAWTGALDPDDGQRWLVVVTRVAADEIRYLFATDAGSDGKRTRGSFTRVGRRVGDKFVSTDSAGWKHEILLGDGSVLQFARSNPAGDRRWTARLARTTLAP